MLQYVHRLVSFKFQSKQLFTNFLGRGQNVKCYLQAGQILQARKHSIYNNIHVYIIYMYIRPNVYIHEHLFYYVGNA